MRAFAWRIALLLPLAAAISAMPTASAHTRSCRRRPVLVADGTEDIVVPAVNSRRLARRIPDARLKLYSHAGHAFRVQDQARFAPLVDRFLSARR
jgi:pimeloyl-ACP methyl ester carboxylesterase